MKGARIIFSFTLIAVSTALRNVSINFPEQVRVNTEVTLLCLYDLEGDTLYSLKWFKGNIEFFRYVPNDQPMTRWFSIRHVKVDLSRSHTNQVVLIDVQFKTSDNYSCEVSGDAPSFATHIATKRLNVTDDDENISIKIPKVVKTTDTVTLECNYDLHESDLYAIKWYKDNEEFYRYLRDTKPHNKEFQIRAFRVNLNESDSHKVVLRNLKTEATGTYHCEVFIDKRSIIRDTRSEGGYMKVTEDIDSVKKDPIVTFQRSVSDSGYILKGNCTAPPSSPAITVTWLLNGKKIESSTKILAVTTQEDKQEFISQSIFEIKTPFRNVEKTVRLQCIATLLDSYKKEVEILILNF